jgi:acetoacetate decarboxylase
MQEKQVLERAFAMPLTSPAYPPGPYRFVNREYLIITYRTDPARLRAVVPEPLELDQREALVKYEFIRMPDSNGFGDYTESGQVIPVSFRGRRGGYTHCMFLNDEGPIAGGRELWGFPKKLAQPTLRTEIDTLVGTLDYGPLRVATGTMGYKHREADLAQVKASLAAPNFLLKIIPHVDGTPRICELVEYHLEDVTVKGAWTGPAALLLSPHALAPVADLPVLEIVSAIHILADLTLGLGRVVHDYLREPDPTSAAHQRNGLGNLMPNGAVDCVALGGKCAAWPTVGGPFDDRIASLVCRFARQGPRFYDAKPGTMVRSSKEH